MASTSPRPRAEISGWAVGLAVFAGCIMLLIGFFQFFEGLAAVIKDKLYVVGPNYAYDIDATAWDWSTWSGGRGDLRAGFGVLTVRTWARMIGIVAILVNAFVQFLYIPYYPLWADPDHRPRHRVHLGALRMGRDEACSQSTVCGSAGGRVSPARGTDGPSPARPRSTSPWSATTSSSSSASTRARRMRARDDAVLTELHGSGVLGHLRRRRRPPGHSDEAARRQGHAVRRRHAWTGELGGR